MKYYSDFTRKYVQDICDALTNEGIMMERINNKPFTPENFESLTELFHSYVIYSSTLFEFLNQRGLINRGKCPYTGQQVDEKSPNWSFFGRTIYVSSEGLKIMQREDDENYEKVMGVPPARKDLSQNKGCSILLGIAIFICSSSILLITLNL